MSDYQNALDTKKQWKAQRAEALAGSAQQLSVTTRLVLVPSPERESMSDKNNVVDTKKQWKAQRAEAFAGAAQQLSVPVGNQKQDLQASAEGDEAPVYKDQVGISAQEDRESKLSLGAVRVGGQGSALSGSVRHDPSVINVVGDFDLENRPARYEVEPVGTENILHADLVEETSIVEGVAVKSCDKRWYCGVGAVAAIALLLGLTIGLVDVKTAAERRAASVTAFVNEISLSSTPIVYSGSDAAGGTPEELANSWLIRSDPQQLSPDTGIGRFRLKQRFALLCIWFQSTNAQWIHSTSWATGDDECDWFNVTCNETILVEEGMDRQSAVTEIRLLNNNLAGFPDDIGLLSSLTALHLAGNVIVGSVPTTFGLLKELRELDLTACGLTGTLPSNMAHLSLMESFNVSQNFFVPGPLPDWLAGMHNLENLEYWSTGLAGTLPSFVGEAWPQLIRFSLHSNEGLTGSLPSSIGLWTDLKNFYVDYCSLTGTLPDGIGAWSRIEQFWANNNQFSGSLPSSIGNWTGVHRVFVEDNMLNGTVPDSIANWNWNALAGEVQGVVELVGFERNNFTGIITSDICTINGTLVTGRVNELQADCKTEVECVCCSACF